MTGGLSCTLRGHPGVVVGRHGAIQAVTPRHGTAQPRVAATVTGLVLAGGRGRRLGGRDKGLVRHRGTVMAAHALRWLEPSCDVLVVSANRHLSRYRTLAPLVVADPPPGDLGPVAGLLAGLGAVRTQWLLSCPCDAAELPPALPARLLRTLRLNGHADAAVARDPQRLQPLVAAWRGNLAPALGRYLSDGGRSAYGLLESLAVVEVPVQQVIDNRNG